ncbi:DMT family transporter [Bacillus salitolerans]|uniref:DMT family transporter n=1 Tax=Bacillus salitolerans TaxID=1437434 RepID=A0ABW4LTI5_9BACI
MILVNYLIMCLIFGTTFLGIKIGIDAGAPPFLSAGVRFFIAGLLLFTWMVMKKKIHVSLLWQRDMLITGICLTFGTFSTLYWAEQYVSSGTAAILSATAPIIIIMIQAFVIREQISKKAVAGCIIAFIGLIILVVPQVSLESNLFWFIGCISILIGQFFYASGALYSKKVIRKFDNISTIALNAAQMIYGGFLLLVLSLFTESSYLDMSSLLNLKIVGSLMYLIVLGSMVGHTLFYWLVSKTNPVFPSTWLYISPIIAMILGIIIYREALSWPMVFGSFTILLGILIANWDALQMNLNSYKHRRNLLGHKL